MFRFCLQQTKVLKSKVTAQSKQVDKLENQVIRGPLLFRLVELSYSLLISDMFAFCIR